jgi:hypothetical protein
MICGSFEPHWALEWPGWYSWCNDGLWGSNPSERKRFYLLCTRLEWPGTHLPSFQWVLGGCVLCFKFGSDHRPLSSAKVKDEWSYTFAHLCASDGMLWGDLYLYLTGLTEQVCCNSLAHFQKCEKQLQWVLDFSVLKGTEKMNEICARTKNPKNHFF